MRYLLVVLLSAICLVGCKKEEEVIETTPPPPPTAAHVEDTSVVLDRWGDENIIFSVQGEEAIQEYTDVQIRVLPSVNQFDYVQIDYIQGVALNDFGKTYWAGYQDETKSDYDSGFKTDDKCFKFVRTEKNSTLMISGPISLEDEVDNIYSRFAENNGGSEG